MNVVSGLRVKISLGETVVTAIAVRKGVEGEERGMRQLWSGEVLLCEVYEMGKLWEGKEYWC